MSTPLPLPAPRTLPPRPPLRRAIGVAARTLGLASGGEPGSGVDLAPLQRTLHCRRPALSLNAYVAGDPAAVRLVLVHGTPGRAQGWARYLKAPPPGCEVLAFDRPGHGASEPRAALTSLTAQAQALAAVLPDEHGRDAVLLGHSLGGAVVAAAAAAAVSARRRVRAVILLAAAIDPALERPHPLQHLGLWPPVRALLPRALRNANAELLALKAELAALAPRLAAIRCPVYIVHGTNDDLVPVANVAYLQRRLTGASRVHTRLIDGAGHFLPWQAEAALRLAIGAALAGEPL